MLFLCAVFMMSSQPTSLTSGSSSAQTSSTSTSASVFSVPLGSQITSAAPPSSMSSSTPLNPVQFAPASTASSLPTFLSSPIASAHGQQSAPSEDSSRFQTAAGLFTGGLPMPAPGTVPPVMPVPIIPPQFAAGPADLLPVDPYLPCNSRHFMVRRSTNAVNQSNVNSQVPIFSS
jgi:hypothetical protein